MVRWSAGAAATAVSDAFSRRRADQKALTSYIFGGDRAAAGAVKNGAAAAGGGAGAIKQTEAQGMLLGIKRRRASRSKQPRPRGRGHKSKWGERAKQLERGQRCGRGRGGRYERRPQFGG